MNAEKFSYYDLGQLQSGQFVELTLKGNAANVRLMDRVNFNNYKNGKKHRFYGGLAKYSPIRFLIPQTTHWYLTIDFQGLSGKVEHSVKILPKPLPEIREGILSNIPGIVRPNLVSENIPSTQKYDVFISHSSEDKDEVARPLAEALQKLGLKVWYDEFTLKIGDSLRRSIDNGLANSQIGLVILSPSFVKKDWTNHELDGIITRSMNNQQLLLPIWHRISKEEVINYSPSLADKLARNTATYTIVEIASEISEFFKRKD